MSIKSTHSFRELYKLFILTALLQLPLVSSSQDFYINQKSEVVSINYDIAPSWINLNINEGYEFLQSANFKEIKTITVGEKEVVVGKIINDEYLYMRKLIFQNKIIREYADIVTFIQPCVLCLANDINNRLKNNPSMQGINEKNHQSARRIDAELKDLFIKNHIKSLNNDGINSILVGELSDYGFNYSNSIKTSSLNITRNCKLELENGKIYNFFSEKRVSLSEESNYVGSYNLNDVNQYDLNLMIDIFLLDCKNNGINIQKGKVIVSFEDLPGETLGLSYGINNNNLIKLKIDPEKWEGSSKPKRWYLLYHELGHDVLNLNHGVGGKMMFNFADKGYSWREFWDDKTYLLESYKRNKK